MLKKLAITIALISALAAYCNKGCLKCTSDNECLYCDATQFYLLVDGRCVAAPIDNCVQMDEKGKCVTCAENYYVDPVQFTCIALPSTLQVSNCALHVGPQSCSYCKTGYVLINGSCQENSNVIQNCTYQNAKGNCLVCAPGYMRNVNRNGCVAVPSISNCATYSSVQCEECQDGYINNPNRYIDQIFAFRNSDQMSNLNVMVADQVDSVVDNSVFKTCQSNTVANCDVFIDYQTCAECSAGYYLTFDARCASNPVTAIPNCNKYTSASTCVDCKQGYFLQSSSTCARVTPLINCLLYETDKPYSSCSRCIQEYYLNADNICKPRTDLSDIDFCAVLADEGESCVQCIPGYQTTGDSLKCLPWVEHCQTYVKSTINSLRHECSVCAPGHYFNTTYKVCSRGTVENCQFYRRDSNDCDTCEPNFYLVSNTCLPHTQLPSCVNYSPVQANACTNCRPFTHLFMPSNGCVAVESIDNCRNYSSKTTCANCNDGFYLANPSECRAIPSNLNCLQLDGNLLCVKCLGNYVLDDGKCFEPQQYIIQNCANSNLDGKTASKDLHCNYCKPNNIPVNYVDSFVCKDKDYIKRQFLPLQQQFDDSCLQFVVNPGTNQLICVKCEWGLVLDGEICVASCTHADNATIYQQFTQSYDINGDATNDSFTVERSFMCGPTIPHCMVAVPNVVTNFAKPTYSCAQCNPGFFQVIEIGGKSGIMRRSERFELWDSDYGTSPLTLVPSVSCTAVETGYANIIGETKYLDAVDGCDYFQMIFPGLYGCNKCKWGFTGIAVDLIKNCKTFSNPTTCIECDTNYYKKSNKECMPVLNILHCTTYDSTQPVTTCIKCEDAFYVSSNACVPRVNSLEVANSTLVDNADNVTCAAKFLLDNVVTPYVCRQIPYNCATPVLASPNVNCTACVPLSYLSGGVCLDGTVKGCAVYANASNTCVTCTNGKYLETNLCKPHAVAGDSMCQTWSQSTLNTCDTCNAKSVKLTVESKCVPVYIPIPHCVLYADIYTCKTCDDGYYLENLSRNCMPIPADLNCLVYSPVDINGDGILGVADLTDNKKYAYTCDQCAASYFRHEVNTLINLPLSATATKLIATCYDYLDFARSNCEETDVDGLVGFGNKYCTGCDATYHPYDYENKYACVEKGYMDLVAPTMDNCDVAVFNGSIYQCKRCRVGFFVSNNLCVADCPASVNTPSDDILPYIFYYSETSGAISFSTSACIVNTEGLANTDGDAFQSAISLFDETIDTVIARCEKDDIAIIDYDPTHYYRAFVDPHANNYNMNSPFDGFEAIQKCLTPVLDTVRGYVNQKYYIDNCEFYHELKTGLYGCSKCRFGYRGRIKDYDDAAATNFGHIEYCEEFLDCDTSITSGMFDSVEASKDNGLINRYFSCFKCKDSVVNPQVVIAAVAAGTPGVTYGEDFNAIYGLRAYDLDNSSNTEKYSEDFDDLDASLSNFCVDETDITNTLGLESNTYEVANCSAYYLNVDSMGNDLDVPLICVACLPGFYPTYDVAALYMVISCTAISDCDTVSSPGNTLNKCMNCIKNYDIYSDTVDYNKCVDPANYVSPAIDFNCYAASDGDNCGLCNPGYEMDTTVSGKTSCFKLTIPGCDEANYYKSFNVNYELDTTVRDTALFLFPGTSEDNELAGCSVCTDASDVLLFNDSNVVNLDSYMCISGTDNSKANVIANCKRHGFDYTLNEFVCRECNNTYILTDDHKCTADLAIRPFCKVAREIDSDFCSQCTSAQYVIIGGICLDTLAGSLPHGLIANCETYTATSKDDAMGTCLTCAAAFYLETDGSCQLIPVSNCNSYDANQGCLVCTNNHARFEILGRSICVDLDANSDSDWDFDMNCQDIVVRDPNVVNVDIRSKHLNCLKCEPDTFLSVVTADLYLKSKCTNIELFIDPQCNAYDIQSTIAASTFKCTGCTSYVTHFLNPFDHTCTARLPISNCATYDHFANLCETCDPNYKLNFTRTACDSMVDDIGLRARNKGYIHTCRPMDSCNTEWFYEGLSADLASFYSCHTCKTPGQIPFIAVRTDGDENVIESLNEFGFNAASSDPLQKGTNGAAVTCMAPAYANFNIAASANFVFPPNCALGLVKVDLAPNALHSSSTSADINKSTVMCTACKPGYSAVGATITSTATAIKYMVSSCTQINNCEYSRWFNACTQCSANYSFSYSLTTGINFNECVSYPENPLCFTVYINGGVKTCKSCKKGSFLNRDGICDLINPPKCEVGNFRFDQYLPAIDLNNGLFAMNDGTGCNRCAEGFAAVYSPENAFVCTESLYLVGTALTASTAYIQHCKNYTSNPLGVIQCAVCDAGYTRTVDSKCTLSSSVANCKLAFSATLCKVCNPGFVIVNRACVAPAIAQCIEYHADTENAMQICIKCAPGYYLAGNTCHAGAVLNCKHLESATRCNQCEDNFTLILANFNTDFCYPNSAKLNCKNFDAEKFQGGVLECKQCANDNFVISTSQSDFQATFCMPFNNLDKCIRFNNGLILSSSSFQCQQCQAGYYLTSGDCIKRTILPAECIAFDQNNDKCTECAYGYYISANGASCVSYPEGIVGCVEYESRSVCKTCDAQMYLVDNKCLSVPAPLTDCTYYHDAVTCKTCAANKFNINGACVTALAQNCATFASLTRCKTCASGYGLQTVGTLVNCVSKNVTSCAVSEDVSPFKCLICNVGFYANNGVCTAVTATIANCTQYDSATTCVRCANRTALSTDRTSCVNTPDVVAQVDPNCTNPVILDEPTCNTCKAGYYFKFGLCTACSAQTLAKGCYNCDPRAPNVCLMCNTGFYMTAEGDCVSVSTVTSTTGRIEAPVTVSKIIADGVALTK